MAEKLTPNEVPNWHALYSNARAAEQDQMGALRAAFQQNSFIGKVVTNWCSYCKKWRLQYVSLEKLQKPVLDETFPCATCAGKVPLIVDEKHTVLSNVQKVRAGG